jgi:hypothetical protein
MCIPSTNLPTLDHAAHPTQQWLTPELGLNSTRQGNSRLGKDNKEVAQNNRKDLLSQEPLTPTTHRPSFPACLLQPRRVHLHQYKSIDYYTSLTLGFNNRLDQKSQSTIPAMRLPSRRTHFPTNFLTWESFSLA